MGSSRGIYDYLIAHLLDAGNTTSRLRRGKFLSFRGDTAGKISCAVSDGHLDPSYRTVVDSLIYLEFQFFCRDSGIVIKEGLSLIPILSRCLPLIGRRCSRFPLSDCLLLLAVQAGFPHCQSLHQLVYSDSDLTPITPALVQGGFAQETLQPEIFFHRELSPQGGFRLVAFGFARDFSSGRRRGHRY